ATTAITDPDDVLLFEKFNDMLNDLEDVQHVFHNAEIG
ncbi:MAG TPA: YebC/PmpR family DNA-binding transcriptional regulator, partial [Oceanospirillales bacterium]|nr:YebC/PmpR family DNA-binding transcriptional regulator [Oceanospirillales bacterium]